MRPKLFLIHGWNMPPLVWDALAEKLRGEFDVQLATLPGYEHAQQPNDPPERSLDSLTELLAQAPERSHWCGWSLGATLAMQAAIKSPERISKLTLISPTARFFETEGWPQGISESVFDRLLRVTLKKYAAGLNSFLRMQLPSEDHHEVRQQLVDKVNDCRPTDVALKSGYQTLSVADLRGQLGEICIPTQIIAADSDEVISPAASQLCADQIPNAIFKTIGHCHCLPVTQPTQLANLLSDFENSPPPASGGAIDRQQVARQFSKAAETYDSAAELQREMGRALIEKIKLTAGGTLIDLGCGTGDALHQIKTQWPTAKLIGVDIAPAMIEKASDRIPDARLVVADIEQTGLPEATAEVVLSCAALQWCEPSRATAEAERLLKPGGSFLMTTFIAGTLPEFREAWRRADPDMKRVHDLVSESDWRQALTDCGFEIKELKTERRCQRFDSVDQMLQQFRKLGAGYAGYDRTPLSRADYANFRDHLCELAGDRPSLTYECLTVLAVKPGR